jgi:hypothetical protein
MNSYLDLILVSFYEKSEFEREQDICEISISRWRREKHRRYSKSFFEAKKLLNTISCLYYNKSVSETNLAQHASLRTTFVTETDMITSFHVQLRGVVIASQRKRSNTLER